MQRSKSRGSASLIDAHASDVPPEAPRRGATRRAAAAASPSPRVRFVVEPRQHENNIIG